MVSPEYTHKVRGSDLKHALKVLNSHNLSRSNGELREALKALAGWAEPLIPQPVPPTRAPRGGAGDSGASKS